MTSLGFGGCAQSPQQLSAATHGKEYFPSSIYGAASRRVVADGQPIPHGGGQYLVGRPYTVAGQTYYPSERRIVQVGNASWYGDAFHGRQTANGEIYDSNSFTAAHPTMPLPSYARVTNLANHYSMIVRVNDRGPYASNRIMDVSRGVAEALDFRRSGTARVKVEYVGRASLAGSDDSKLYASLRQGAPAQWTGDGPTEVAEAPTPRPRVAALEPETATDARERPISPPRESARAHRDEALDRDAAISARPHARHERDDARPVVVAHRDTKAERATRFAMAEMKSVPLPPARGKVSRPETVRLPPSRPLDLATIPGAGSQIGRSHGIGLRTARARDDD